jgi:shikimate kinase
MRVILFGMKHCGKSTLGGRLADQWGCGFYDVDDLIEAAYLHRQGAAAGVREILTRHGEQYFAGLEADVVIELGKLLEAQPSAVVALGGRTATNQRAVRIIRHVQATKVYLVVEPDELLRRILAGGVPPFLDAADPHGSFMRLLESRRAAYESLADLTVDLGRLGPDEAYAALLTAIDGAKR